MRSRDDAYSAFEIIREQLELTRREREPARVVDGPLAVDKYDDAVLSVQ
jgi:hypothetical protein